jgi:hypothetical protein
MLGFMPSAFIITALDAKDGAFSPFADRSRTVSYCGNHQYSACNWLVEIGGNPLCQACQLNHTIPDISQPQNLQRWQSLELAKHRLVYSLLRLGLPVESKEEGHENGIAFDFLAPSFGVGAQKVLTGHDHGGITLNVTEADDAIRAGIQEKMGEAYRTLLGHFRHEIAHYYFERVVEHTDNHRLFRDVFGDETADYNQALQVHYANGAPADWQDRYISAYASAHPHEDWAETFAHYLHMIDTLETAYALSLRVRPKAGDDESMTVAITFDPYTQPAFEPIIDVWLPVTFAVNSLNRSMGIADLYPFIVSPAVIQKLNAVHQIVRSAGHV